MLKKSNFWFYSNATDRKQVAVIENTKFLNRKQTFKQHLFFKEFLLSAMTHNVIYFCLKTRELANLAKYVWPIVIYINAFTNLPNAEKWWPWKSKTNLITTKKSIFLTKKDQIKNNLASLTKSKLYFKLVKVLKLFLLESNSNLLSKKKNWSTSGKNVTPSDIKKNVVWAFLMVWATKNNFFVTVIDNKGNVLITRSGGNSEWTGTKQRSTVFSADSAVYEACFIAKGLGVEAVSIHVRSTFWLPQIKNCFDGLEATGLIVHELIYRPLKAFGGCWKKKPRRV